MKLNGLLRAKSMWGILFICLLFSIKPLKKAYDAWQLESMLVNNQPETWKEQCLVSAYRAFIDFKSSFERTLKARNDSLIARMNAWENRKAAEPNIHNFMEKGELLGFLNAGFIHKREALKADTANSKRVTFTLYDGYREYCLSEAACFDGKYNHYTYCMRNGPQWRLSGWEYPIMWSLDD